MRRFKGETAGDYKSGRPWLQDDYQLPHPSPSTPGAVLAASEAFMLTDASPSLQDTRAFVERRVADVASFGQGAGGAIAVGLASASGIGSILGAAASLLAPIPASLLQLQQQRRQPEGGGRVSAPAAAEGGQVPPPLQAAAAAAAAAGEATMKAVASAAPAGLREPLESLPRVGSAIVSSLQPLSAQGPGAAVSEALRAAAPQLIPGSGGAVDTLAAALLPPSLSSAGGAVVKGLFGRAGAAAGGAARAPPS